MGEETQNNKELRLQLDNIMKDMFGVSSKVLLMMMNSLFEEDYDLEYTDISLSNNEFVLDYRGYDIIRGDVFLRIQERQKKPNHYHIDFQTLYDRDMVIRMFAYGLSKARELSKNIHYQSDTTKEDATIYIPRQLVIYMEEHREIKDRLNLKIVFPDGFEKEHEVSVMKYWEYRTSDLIEKKLYPLLPLQVFRLRHGLSRIKPGSPGSDEKYRELLWEVDAIINEIGHESSRLYNEKVITGEDYHKILLAINNLINYLNTKFGKIDDLEKEVGKMIKTLIDPVVKEEGRDEGREAMKECIHDLLSDLVDYSYHKVIITEELCKVKELSQLRKLITISARVKNVKEFLQHLNR